MSNNCCCQIEIIKYMYATYFSFDMTYFCFITIITSETIDSQDSGM